MRKIHKIHTRKSEALNRDSARKRRKKRINITIDEDVGEVLDKLYIKKSKFINDLLRTVLFGEGDLMSFLKSLWWARGDLNPGPSPCEGDVITSLDHGPPDSHTYLFGFCL